MNMHNHNPYRCPSCELLEERIRQLEAALIEPARFPRHWGLSQTQSEILAHIMARGTASRESFQVVLWGNRIAYPTERNLDVHVYRLRQQLNKYLPEVKIEAVRGVGYRMSPEHVAILRTKYGAHP